jgi:hypothetical protein
VTRSEGTCKINGVSLGEITISFLGASPHITAKYALCNIETEDKFGAGNRNSGWSEETYKKLQALALSMEVDVLSDVFSGSPTTNGAVTEVPDATDGVPGL